MLFQRPYISKSPGGACLRTPLAAHAFGARDCPPLPPPPPNKSNLATAVRGVEGQATVKAEVEEDDEKCNTDSDLDDPKADSDDDHLMFLRAVSTRRGRMVRFIYQE